MDKSLNGKELVRLSIINGANGEPLMDTLVRPGNPVVDWRTSIHGVAPEHMEGVLFTHRYDACYGKGAPITVAAVTVTVSYR